MNILQRIIIEKHKEVERSKLMIPAARLEKGAHFNKLKVSITQSLNQDDSSGVIAEFKRKSPSKGIINDSSLVGETASGYQQAGVAAISILTDESFFGGSNEDLFQARSNSTLPLLRKDFIVDEYQLLEAKSIGADVILLIAAVLIPKQTLELATMAQSLGMEVLLEVNSKEELETHLNQHLNLVGVNNRNLTDFSLNVNLSFELAEFIPTEFVKVAESAISNPQVVVDLKKEGFKGFLIGENFMKTPQPAKACADFINDVKALSVKS